MSAGTQTKRTTPKKPVNKLNPSNRVQRRRPRVAKRGNSGTIIGGNMFSGGGGSGDGMVAAGIDLWWAANHWEVAIRTHEGWHPRAEHFIADLVDETKADYMDPWDLPYCDFLWASPSCTNHSKASFLKAYRRKININGIADPGFDARVEASERSRATATCVLQYIAHHYPLMGVVENVPEFLQWGDEIPGTNIGDGTTFELWHRELRKLGYRTKIVNFNSMFANAADPEVASVPQSRNRVYICFWQEFIDAPDLEFTPRGWCQLCDREIEAHQQYKRRGPTWPCDEYGMYGKRNQYLYVCPSCRSTVHPYTTGSETVIDWSDLGTRIGDRDLVENTMARIFRAQQMVIDDLRAGRLSVGSLVPYRRGTLPTSLFDPMPTQGTHEAFGLTRPGALIPMRKNTLPTTLQEPMFTQTAQQKPMMIQAPAAIVKNNGSKAEAKYRASSITEPLGAFTAHPTQALVSAPISLFAKQNGGPNDTAWHYTSDPFNTLTTRPGANTALLSVDELAALDPLDWYYRMLKVVEIQGGMGVSLDRVITGTQEDQVKQLGNMVTPPSAEMICKRMLAVLK